MGTYGLTFGVCRRCKQGQEDFDASEKVVYVLLFWKAASQRLQRFGTNHLQEKARGKVIHCSPTGCKVYGGR